MKIDLHIHTKTCSDGALSIEEVFQEARKRNINLMSTTDHDSTDIIEEYMLEYTMASSAGIQDTMPRLLPTMSSSPRSTACS